MSITETFAHPSSYGITYVSLSNAGLQFESEAAVHLDDGSVQILRMPTRQSEKLTIQDAVCREQTA